MAPKAQIFPSELRHWIKLSDDRWECAEWIDKRRLRNLGRSLLEEQWVEEDPDDSPVDRALGVLRGEGEFVAMD
jgi:hypothetical protein